MVASALVGREREVSALAGMLGDGAVRLVTVTGPPGVGKTRVARAVADRLERKSELRVIWVELGPIGDPGLVVPAIAAAAGAEEGTGRQSPADAAVSAMADGPALLALDNFEHVGQAAPDVAALLEACPRIVALATSRHVMGLSFERMFPLAPLALPEPGGDPAQAGRYASVALFVERACARDPTFVLTAEVAPAVSEICRRLDGLPLAIELVAARVGTVPPPALLARWEDAVGLDTRGARDLPLRQQTLRRALDWSYELLDSQEQALLRRLAAFPGGFDLASVSAACRGDADTLPALDLEPIPALAQLLDRSLVERQGGSTSEPRYWQLVTVRSYLRERLAAHGEAAAADRLMAETCAALAREPDQFFGFGGWREALDRVELELNNLHAALDVFVRSEPARAVELASNLYGFWRVRQTREGRKWLERALAAAGRDLPAGARARGLWVVAILAGLQGDVAQLRRFAAASLAAAREAGDDLLLGRALYAEAWALQSTGDKAAAAGCLRESLGLCEAVDDSYCAAAACNDLGELARAAGELEEAAAYYERALELRREIGDAAGYALSELNLALALLAGGDLDRAGELLLEVLAETSDMGYRRLRAMALAALTAVAAARGPGSAVATLYGAAQAELEVVDAVLEPLDAKPFREAGSALRNVLAAKQLAAAQARGRALGQKDQQRLVERIFDVAPAPEAGPLTRRELEVVRLIAEGLTNSEIAERLVVSDHTVHRHVANILRKLGVHSRAAAASLAAQTGLL